jgi:hypothetical protein
MAIENKQLIHKNICMHLNESQRHLDVDPTKDYIFIPYHKI